jgi:WD40 repeat protein
MHKRVPGVTAAPPARVFAARAHRGHECSAPRHIQQFGNCSGIVTALERVPSTNMILTATTDGSVNVWSSDSVNAKFKMRAEHGVSGLCFTGEAHLAFHSARSIHVILLRHFFATFAECSAVPTSAKLVAPGCIMTPCSVRGCLGPCVIVRSASISLILSVQGDEGEAASKHSPVCGRPEQAPSGRHLTYGLFVQDTSVRFLKASNGESITTVPPQLTTHAIASWCFDALACRLFVLLNNSDIHIWTMPSGAPATLTGIWTQASGERLACLGLLIAGSMRHERAQALGLCASVTAPPDLVVAGTEEGDVVFLHPDSEDVAMRFCAHKQMRITHVLACADEHRLLTVTDTGLKVWDLGKGVKMVRATSSASPVSCVASFGPWFVLGTSAGGVRWISTRSGEEQAGGGPVHSKCVTSIQADLLGQRAVSSSLDGTLKVWSAARELLHTIWVGRPLTCACFANGTGDIVCGVRHELIRICGHMYQDVCSRRSTPQAAAGSDAPCSQVTVHVPLAVRRSARSVLARDAHACAWLTAVDATSHSSGGDSGLDEFDDPSDSDSASDGSSADGHCLKRAPIDVQNMTVAALAQLRKAQMQHRFAAAGTAVATIKPLTPTHKAIAKAYATGGLELDVLPAAQRSEAELAAVRSHDPSCLGLPQHDAACCLLLHAAQCPNAESRTCAAVFTVVVCSALHHTALQEAFEALRSMDLASKSAGCSTATPPATASATILEAVKRLVLATDQPASARPQAAPALAGSLQPSLRRALGVVAHPLVFLNGYFPEELKEPATKIKQKKKTKRRRRKKKRVAASGLAGLEQRAADDAALYGALSEYKWSDSICKSAMTALVPKQTFRASDVAAEPVGAIGRAPEDDEAQEST